MQKIFYAVFKIISFFTNRRRFFNLTVPQKHKVAKIKQNVLPKSNTDGKINRFYSRTRNAYATIFIIYKNRIRSNG